MVSFFKMVIAPPVPTQTSPASVPGIRMPSPVSAVTVPVKLKAVGLGFAFFTYPGQCDADTLVSAGALLWVLEPEIQLMVPPFANCAAGSADELPPVLPPVHPLITIVLDEFPTIVVHVIFPVAAPAVPEIPNVRPTTGMSMAATVSKIRRINSSP
jgi:hypothetical protein